MSKKAQSTDPTPFFDSKNIIGSLLQHNYNLYGAKCRAVTLLNLTMTTFLSHPSVDSVLRGSTQDEALFIAIECRNRFPEHFWRNYNSKADLNKHPFQSPNWDKGIHVDTGSNSHAQWTCQRTIAESADKPYRADDDRAMRIFLQHPDGSDGEMDFELRISGIEKVVDRKSWQSTIDSFNTKFRECLSKLKNNPIEFSIKQLFDEVARTFGPYGWEVAGQIATLAGAMARIEQLESNSTTAEISIQTMIRVFQVVRGVAIAPAIGSIEPTSYRALQQIRQFSWVDIEKRKRDKRTGDILLDTGNISFEESEAETLEFTRQDLRENHGWNVSDPTMTRILKPLLANDLIEIASRQRSNRHAYRLTRVGMHFQPFSMYQNFIRDVVKAAKKPDPMTLPILQPEVNKRSRLPNAKNECRDEEVA